MGRYETPKIVEIFSTPDTERGSKGFGSIGTGTITSGRSADTETEKPEGKLNQLTASLAAKCTTIDECAISMDEPLNTVLSKGAKGIAYILAVVLRHTARKDGLDMGPDGYVLVKDLLSSK